MCEGLTHLCEGLTHFPSLFTKGMEFLTLPCTSSPLKQINKTLCVTTPQTSLGN